MKKTFFGAILSLIWIGVSLNLTACDDDDSDIPHAADVYKRMSVKLDSELTHDEKALLTEDLYQTMQYDLGGVDPKSVFAKAFGGVKTDNVVDYLDARINYILPQKVKLNSRLGVAETVDADQPTDDKIYTVALNVGTVLWFEALAKLPQKIEFTIDGDKIPLESSRVGIIQLGEGYTLKKDDDYIFPQVIRVSTLVHEARHSDCTGGALASDLARIIKGELPSSHACGHLHVRCPEGHAYEGSFACDAEAWGAYSIEAVYDLALMKTCKNCSTADKKMAEIAAADSLSRVLIPLEDLYNGKAGAPDMSSSNLIIKDDGNKPLENVQEQGSLRAQLGLE